MNQVKHLEDESGRFYGTEFTCRCGHEVTSYVGSDTSCDKCGQLYNAFGQALNHPSQWSEDGSY